MSRHNQKTGAKRDRTNLSSEITDKIITELEAGRVPWVQPWGTAAERRNRPALFRDQRAPALGRRHRARVRRPELAHLPPGAVARRQCPQGRARHDGRLCRLILQKDSVAQMPALAPVRDWCRLLPRTGRAGGSWRQCRLEDLGQSSMIATMPASRSASSIDPPAPSPSPS